MGGGTSARAETPHPGNPRAGATGGSGAEQRTDGLGRHRGEQAGQRNEHLRRGQRIAERMVRRLTWLTERLRQPTQGDPTRVRVVGAVAAAQPSARP